MVLPISARRKGGAVPIGYLAALVTMISTMLSLGAAPHARALAVGLQLPVTPLTPVVNAVNDVTSQLPVPVSIQSTPSTVGASVDPSLPIISNPSASNPAAVAAPIRVSVPLPVTPSVLIPAAANSAPANTAPAATQPSVAKMVASSPTVANTGTTAVNTPATNEVTTPAKPSNPHSGLQAAPMLGITGFINSVPAALQSLARGIAGNVVDNFAYIIMGDFLFAMLALSAGLAGARYQTNRSDD